MARTPDTPLTATAEPIFVEALAAAAHCTPVEAVQHMGEVADLTDLHRVDTYLEYFAA